MGFGEETVAHTRAAQRSPTAPCRTSRTSRDHPHSLRALVCSCWVRQIHCEPGLIAVILLASLIVAVSVLWAARRVAEEIRAAREAASRTRAAALLDLFAPAIAAADR